MKKTITPYGVDKSNGINTSRAHEDAQDLLKNTLGRKYASGGTIQDVENHLTRIVERELRARGVSKP